MKGVAMSHMLDFIKASCGIVSITPVATSKPSGPYRSNLPAIVPAKTPGHDRPVSPDPRMFVQKPRSFQVVLLNDDYTPMRYVERVLQRYFHKGAEDACRIMMQVHRGGQAVAGTYSYEVAEHKSRLVEDDAKGRGFPFKTRLEPV